LPLMMFWKSSKTLNCSARAILADDQIRVESGRVKNRNLVGAQVGSQFFVLYSRVGELVLCYTNAVTTCGELCRSLRRGGRLCDLHSEGPTSSERGVTLFL
jgi:hypothetical protein